jgi:phosphatidate cytidylyltransferase
MKRILTAAVLVPFLIFIIGFTSPLFFTFLVALATFLALEEFFLLAKKSGIEVHRLWGHLFSLLLIASFHLCSHTQSAAFLLLGLSGIFFLALGTTKGQSLHQIFPSSSATLLGLAYVPTTLGLLVVVRSSASLGNNAHWILFLLLVVWFGDTGAYYVGRALGRHKLAPLISPKKTVEGAIGGILGNTVAAFLGKKILLPAVPIVQVLVLSWVLGLVSQIGDLAESALKRAAGVKDSSNLLPGHGGMLDRIDGLLFAAPVLFCYTKFFLK